MNKILLVEDSEEHQLIVSRALANANIEITVAGSYKETLSVIKKNGSDFDLAILDLVLPDGDGFKVLEDLRSTGMSEETPVFFLTSQAELNSKVTAFNLGADDYLIKPISPVELRARVEMRLRKAVSQLHEIIKKGQLTLEIIPLRASRNENGNLIDLNLTAKEFKILSFLVQNENKIFKRSELVQSVWGKGINILDRTVDSHIYGLRKKMGPLAHYVECVPSAGYRFILNGTEDSHN